MRLLKLGKNHIESIHTLSKAKFKDLEELDLFDNKISDISVLKDVPFKKIKRLDISFNQIKSVDVLLTADFKFEELKFEGNSNLDYSNNNPNIQKLYDQYKIPYSFYSLTNI